MASVRLMTFNICRDGQGFGVKGWPTRRPAVMEVIREHSPDIVALQEVRENQLVDLDGALAETGYARAGARLDGDPTLHRNPIYHRREKFRCDAQAHFELAGYTSAAKDGRRIGRSLNWASLVDADGTSIPVANVHLDPDMRSGDYREIAIDEIVGEAGLRGVVLMGDFNEAPSGPLHARLRALGWSDSAAGSTAAASELATFHGYVNRPTRRIDWIMLPARWHVRSHRVVRDAPKGVLPSDHYPVVVRVDDAPPQIRAPDAAAATPRPRPQVLAALRAWRLAEARARRVPAYVIALDSTLEAVAEARPTSLAELKALKGIGPVTVERYGETLLALCVDEIPAARSA